MSTKVLLVDDSPIITTMLSSILESKNIEVIAASSGIEAMMAFYQEAPDLVFLDTMLSDIPARMICYIIKSSHKTKNIPVVLLSNQNKTSKSSDIVEADFCISKNPKKLLEAVDLILKKLLHHKKKLHPQNLDMSQTFSCVCNELLPQLEELSTYRQIMQLFVMQNPKEIMNQLFQALSRIMEFNIGVLFFPYDNIIYQYTNLPSNDGLFAETQAYILERDNHKDPERVILNPKDHKTTSEHQDLKAFFYQPIFCSEVKVAVLMLASSEDIVETQMARNLNAYLPMFKSTIIYISVLKAAS